MENFSTAQECVPPTQANCTVTGVPVAIVPVDPDTAWPPVQPVPTTGVTKPSSVSPFIEIADGDRAYEVLHYRLLPALLYYDRVVLDLRRTPYLTDEFVDTVIVLPQKRGVVMKGRVIVLDPAGSYSRHNNVRVALGENPRGVWPAEKKKEQTTRARSTENEDWLDKLLALHVLLIVAIAAFLIGLSIGIAL